MEQQLFSVDEVARILGTSRSRIYKMIEAGDLQTVTFGARQRITDAALSDYVRGLK